MNVFEPAIILYCPLGADGFRHQRLYQGLLVGVAENYSSFNSPGLAFGMFQAKEMTRFLRRMLSGSEHLRLTMGCL